LKNHEDFCIAMERTTLQARKKNWGLLVRAKVDISTLVDHLSISRHVFFVTTPPLPIQKAETPLI